MLPLARYNDGKTASTRNVTFAITRDAAAPAFIIADPDSMDEIDRWPVADMFEVPARIGELLLGARSRPTGARLRIGDEATVIAARTLLPGLEGQRRADSGQQLRIIGLATAALVSVIVAYVVGIPLLASRIVPMVPTQWEAALGETALDQIDDLIRMGGGIRKLCDPDPDSVANRAIGRFAAEVVDGTGSPFAPEIQVLQLEVPNAFALPGGHSYYFSALLHLAESPDEFAGVLAHELGHVVHRHALEQLIATSSTGLLVGFIMGDMTGLSVAGGLGAALIDTRYSRDAERQADAFAGAAGQRLGFRPAALADLLERVAADDPTGQVLQVFSTHPLTAERRAALAAMPEPPPGRRVFTAAEWDAIRTMCD